MEEALTIPKRETGSKMITVRFTPTEYAQLEIKAKKSGVPLATLVRASAMFLIERDVKVN